MNKDRAIPGALSNVIRIDDERIRGHLDRVVRGTVEETLNRWLAALDGVTQFPGQGARAPKTSTELFIAHCHSTPSFLAPWRNTFKPLASNRYAR